MDYNKECRLFRKHPQAPFRIFPIAWYFVYGFLYTNPEHQKKQKKNTYKLNTYIYICIDILIYL